MPPPDPAKWPRLAAIVDQALALESIERSAFLNRACAGDAILRAEAERLLAGQALAFLEFPAAQLADALIATLPPLAEDSLLGSVIGPYRVLRQLARGGMGAVYLGERADGQFRQEVALKLIKRGMDSEEIHRRFLSERQILAGLSHPCIARLLDGGVTAEGQPWFAMEYVDGAPITVHCEQRRLDPTDRLRLFEDVCRAVRYAHQNLVVHRDLKPSNILVTADGQVKLLDFGIAKLLHEGPDAETLTRAGSRVMTPEYAAPEQVWGEPVTTATDVYALGAVLYELLTGSPAHRFERATASEVERVVCVVVPEPPSAAVARHADLPLAERDRLRRTLQGDVDVIVLKALQKDSSRRYPSADAFLGDLERHRTGLPVQARPDTRFYRAGKFVRRHRAGVGAAMAVIVALVVGLAGTIWQARSARREAAAATEVKNFVKDLFHIATPAESRGRKITAEELVDRGVRRVDSALIGQPDVRLELLHFLGEVNRDLGLYTRANSLFERSTRLARGLHGAGSLAEANELATWATVDLEQGRYVRAESLLRTTLAVRKKGGIADSTISTNLHDLGVSLEYQGKYLEAESLHREGLAIDRRVRGERSAEVAQYLDNLGTLLGRRWSLADADSALRASLAIRRQLLDPGHPLVLASMQNLAAVLQLQGRLAEAESLERRVVAEKRKVYPTGHPDLAFSLQQLELVLSDQGRYAQAESLLVEALGIRRTYLGVDHPDTRAVEANLGTLRYLMGDLSGAERTTREALASDERSLGKDHPTTALIRANLAGILSDLGRYAEAEPLLRQALVARRPAVGDSSPDIGLILRKIGVLQHRQGRLRNAELTLRDGITIERASLPADHPWVAQTMSALGAVLVDEGSSADAEPMLRQALASQRAHHGTDDPRTLATESLLGECLAALGRSTEAESLLVGSARKLRASPYGAKELPGATRRLAEFLRARGHPRGPARVHATIAR